MKESRGSRNDAKSGLEASLVELDRSHVFLVVEQEGFALPAAALDELLNAVHGLHARAGRHRGVLPAKVGKHHAGLLNGVLESLDGRGDVAGSRCKLSQCLDGRLGPVRARHGRALGELHEQVVLVVRLAGGAVVHGSDHWRHAVAMDLLKDVVGVLVVDLGVAVVVLKDAHAIAGPLVAARAAVVVKRSRRLVVLALGRDNVGAVVQAGRRLDDGM